MQAKKSGSGKICGVLQELGNAVSDEISLEERKVIYRARRGLKEIDVYFDPYVKNHYLQADAFEKGMFEELVEQVEELRVDAADFAGVVVAQQQVDAEDNGAERLQCLS